MNKIKKINAADINYENYPKQYTSCVILNYDNKLIDDVPWAIKQCQERNLI